MRSIAASLDRAPSTIFREVAVNGGRYSYRPGWLIGRYGIEFGDRNWPNS